MRRLLLLASLVLAAACEQAIERPYPDAVVEAFMTSCRAQRGATLASCTCSIEKIQRTFTLEQFRAFEQQLAQGHPPGELFDAIAECRGS